MENYNLLLVDDEPNILRALTRLFRQEHVNILTATNGAEALEIIRSQPIQVLVTDNIMPVMSGIELLGKVKQYSPNTVRIILSGHSDMEAVLSAVNQGEAFRFLLKPWNDVELRATVSLALAHYRLIENNENMMNDLREKNEELERLKASQN